MRFLLTNTVNGKVLYFTEPKEYKLGRKACDILLENDQSISREHAIIRVKDDHITITDCGSRYHTYHNSDPLTSNVETKLNPMDEIQFGMFQHKYVLTSYEYIVAASALSTERKEILIRELEKCNAKYVEKWSDQCTHLTVDKLTLTIKVLHALVDEKPIVTSNYWTDFAKSIDEKGPIPDVHNYNKPPVAEQLLNPDFEYKIDRRRKSLFHNKLFIFLKKNVKKQMESVIESCGGSCIAWEESPKTLFDIKRSPVEHIIIKPDNETNESFNEIIKDFIKQKKRLVPLNEIALAIIYCSCEVNCNPNFDKVAEVFASAKQEKSRQVLALETQTQDLPPYPSHCRTETVVPSSLEDDWALNIDTNKNEKQVAGTSGIKRPNLESAGQKSPKKLKLQNDKSQPKQSKIDAFVSIQKTKESEAEGHSSKDKPQTSQKRKAVDEIDSASNVKINPFNLFHAPGNKKSKFNEEANPFELTRRTKPTINVSPGNNRKNPFANIMNVSARSTVAEKYEDIKPKLESTREIKLISFRTESSSPGGKKSFINLSWLSKNTVKTEPKEEDPDLAEISKAFKNCVRVEIVQTLVRSPNSTVTDTSFEGLDGRRNFKRFKKVKPLKPQTVVMGRHQFKKIGPGDVTGIDVNDVGSDDEDAGSSKTKNKSNVKPIGKRFFL